MSSKLLLIGEYVYIADSILSVKEICRAIESFRKKGKDWEVIAKSLTVEELEPLGRNLFGTEKKSHKDKIPL